MSNPWLAPVFLPGTEPQLQGYTDEEKEQMKQMQKWQKIGGDFMLYCPTKLLMAGTMGTSRARASVASGERQTGTVLTF